MHLSLYWAASVLQADRTGDRDQKFGEKTKRRRNHHERRRCTGAEAFKEDLNAMVAAFRTFVRSMPISFVPARKSRCPTTRRRRHRSCIGGCRGISAQLALLAAPQYPRPLGGRRMKPPSPASHNRRRRRRRRRPRSATNSLRQATQSVFGHRRAASRPSNPADCANAVKKWPAGPVIDER